MQTIDPFGDIGQYENVLIEIANMVLSFIRDNIADELSEKFQPSFKIKSRTYLNMFVNQRIKNWRLNHEELGLDSVSEYFLSNGFGKLGILDRVQTWVYWHKGDCFPTGVWKDCYPDKDQCNQIIDAIESGNFSAAKQIFEKLFEFARMRIGGIENHLTRPGDSKYAKDLQNELRLTSVLLLEYKEYVELLELEMKRK